MSFLGTEPLPVYIHRVLDLVALAGIGDIPSAELNKDTARDISVT